MSVENIMAKFPIKNDLEIIGEPTYKAINKLREVLYANASTIPTMLGGGEMKWPHSPTNGNISLC